MPKMKCAPASPESHRPVERRPSDLRALRVTHHDVKRKSSLSRSTPRSSINSAFSYRVRALKIALLCPCSSTYPFQSIYQCD